MRHARLASLRGTKDSFRIDVEGSDKQYDFSVLAADSKCSRLAVAESPVHAFSLDTLVKLTKGRWRGNHYLSLGGISPASCSDFSMVICTCYLGEPMSGQ